jgi:hypothetical protein
MDEPTMDDVKECFERWMDFSDIPDEAVEELSMMGAAYLVFDLLGALDFTIKAEALIELLTCTFNLGRAYGYPDLLGNNHERD